MQEILSKDKLYCIVCHKPLKWEKLTKSQKGVFYSSGRSRIYCSGECSKEYCRQVSSETMSNTNRKYASARMKANNPSKRQEVKEKMSAAKKGKPFPAERGGNGHGLTVPQKILIKALSELNPCAEYCIKTEGLVQFPSVYKIDIAIPDKMLAIEVDGKSHHSIKVKEADKRKATVLEQKGWKLLRFTNEQILANCPKCVAQILSTI